MFAVFISQSSKSVYMYSVKVPEGVLLYVFSCVYTEEGYILPLMVRMRNKKKTHIQNISD